ncbi:IS982 family transposase [Meiothermus ruber]|uniref:IS982 family transposase n=1 Tax=Meiothermus ruber TaxID=277 RepID=UPI0003490633|nr:IS982 family transposase [Meiothermus ruber]GAO74406.1 transposase IS4 family protein [Meiothermus ruber H328]GAO74556.1 transposase IS4 family protein [Meiothermus ruber H328]GAO74952.1 transposase IS4 family protein [Meiothermus ruber H328]GAO76334.1 transposase IS4 family protein [Meiothermus ruber H328]
MNWTVLVAFCIIDDLLKTLGHKDDPQSKTPASVVLTLWILAALAFAGKHKHALIYAKEQGLFSYIPSPSRFSRRLHSLAHWIPLLLSLSKTLWEQLSSVEHYILDTLPLPVCENIRAPRCRLAPARIYRGYIPSKRSYFHGLKLHLVCTDNQWISEVLLTPGATADVEGLYRLPLDLPQGSELYVDRGYTDYQAEDDLAMAEGIRLRTIRKGNSKRYHPPGQFIATVGRKIIESVGAALTELFPKRIHATTLQGFVLKVWGFIFAHNFRRLASIL